METCEVCGAEAQASRHPCRFEKACSCWRGEACVTLRFPGMPAIASIGPIVTEIPTGTEQR